ncbi:MAG: hypothetical protein EOO76_13140 [Novosphingobium sp.]|nr:MAG: hypothetical protein EOO76_13140 [Novosphingobium sp.]
MDILAIMPLSVLMAYRPSLNRHLMVLPIFSARAKKTDLIEPWLVEVALARFGDKRLTLDQQRQVVKKTSNPKTVAWPEWWEVLP